MAFPRESTTDAGIGTRFEEIRTTSFGSTSPPPSFASGAFLSTEPNDGSGSAMGPGGFFAGVVFFVSWRRPDWPKETEALNVTQKLSSSPNHLANPFRFIW
jgi:hypothetical protein